MREIYRILDANFNRAREALRVAEDCGRFALNDPAITAMAKNLRSELQEVLTAMPVDEMLTSRDTPGDIGTEMSSPTEPVRNDLRDVATAACKRLTEALRTIEEYGKVVAPGKSITLERLRYNAYTLEQRIIGRLLVGDRFDKVRLYVLIGTQFCRGSLRETAREVIAGGADALQLRQKETPDSLLLAMAAELREMCDETNRLFIMNDRADIAALVGADGVHLGQDDLPVAEARRLLRPGAIVGRSSHTLAQAQAADLEGADYISVGPIFETATKDAGPVVGPKMFAKIDYELTKPLVAIGGINAGNVGELVSAGVKRVAVCSAVCAAADPRGAAAEIREKLS